MAVVLTHLGSLISIEPRRLHELRPRKHLVVLSWADVVGRGVVLMVGHHVGLCVLVLLVAHHVVVRLAYHHEWLRRGSVHQIAWWGHHVQGALGLMN